MLIDSPLALRNLFLNFFIQLPICRPPALHSAGAAVEQAAHPIRQHAVCGVGGDVVGGAGLFVVVGGDGAHKVGGGAAGAAASHGHTGDELGVLVVALAEREREGEGGDEELACTVRRD